MNKVTARVTLATKQEQPNSGDAGNWLMTFSPDYADGRNKEWAAATPYLHLQMTVVSAVARLFEVGRQYTLTFEDTPAEAAPAAEFGTVEASQ